MNEQISAKLGSLVELQQDFEDIDGKLVENANILLQQQGKLRRQQQMKKAIPEQRDILRKL